MLAKNVSIIVPAYNDEKQIAKTLEDLHKALPRAEIVVVDDGSADRTAAVAAKQAKVVRHAQNQGKGAAMRTGSRKATRSVLLFIDAAQFHAEEAPRVLNAVQNSGLVVGVRDWTVIPWHRRITNALTRLAVFLGTGHLVSDPLSGFRAIRKKDFVRLNTKENRYCIEAEMMFKALLRGFKVGEVPVRVAYSRMPHMRLGSTRTQPSTFFRQRFLDEAWFNIRTVLKIWARRFK